MDGCPSTLKYKMPTSFWHYLGCCENLARNNLLEDPISPSLPRNISAGFQKVSSERRVLKFTIFK